MSRQNCHYSYHLDESRHYTIHMDIYEHRFNIGATITALSWLCLAYPHAVLDSNTFDDDDDDKTITQVYLMKMINTCIVKKSEHKTDTCVIVGHYILKLTIEI